MFNKRKFMSELVLKGITVKDLANELNLSCSALYKKINNKSHFYCFEMKKLSKVLEISDPIEYFYNEN